MEDRIMRITRSVVPIVLWFGSSMNVYAQNLPSAELADTYNLFPQFVDGRFPDGSSYRSTIMIQSGNTFLRGITCTLTLRGMTTTLGSETNAPTGSAFSIDLPAGGYYTRQTRGTQAFQGGYASLLCNSGVY